MEYYCNDPEEEYYAGTEDPVPDEQGTRYEITINLHRCGLFWRITGTGPYKVCVIPGPGEIGQEIGIAASMKYAKKIIRKHRKKTAPPVLVYAEQDGAEILPDLRTVSPV